MIRELTGKGSFFCRLIAKIPQCFPIDAGRIPWSQNGEFCAAEQGNKSPDHGSAKTAQRGAEIRKRNRRTKRPGGNGRNVMGGKVEAPSLSFGGGMVVPPQRTYSSMIKVTSAGGLDRSAASLPYRCSPLVICARIAVPAESAGPPPLDGTATRTALVVDYRCPEGSTITIAPTQTTSDLVFWRRNVVLRPAFSNGL